MGMKEKLGFHPNSHVLKPIPQKKTNSEIAHLKNKSKGSREYRIIYFGNLFDYGMILGSALKELEKCSSIRLEVRGSNPPWEQHFTEQMIESKRLFPFEERAILDQWIATADACLATQLFEPVQRQRMETNFISKILDYAQYGKPIVIWGPEYGSAVQWARKGNRALCVTDPDPSALRKALELLATLPDEQQRLATAARIAAHTEFNPDVIQKQFMGALHELICTGDHSYNA